MIAKKLQLDHVEIAKPISPKPSRPTLVHSRRGNVDYPSASIGSRFIAMFIDGFLGQLFTGLMMAGINLASADLVSQDDPILLLGVTMLVALSSIFFINCVPMMFTSQTPGKKLMGLKVVSMKPDPELGIGQIMGRELVAKGVSGIMLGIGYLMAIWDKDNLSWHDKKCDTRVVSIR